MQVILRGLNGDACEQRLTSWLSPFFTVQRVKMVREGERDSPWALIEVADSYEYVWSACQRLRGVFRDGKRLHFYIPLHQTAVHHDLAPAHSGSGGAIS
ncbi:RNA-binding protein [Oxalobacteraceae bacterium OTU3REALA1]|nr:RNA-binding protein [Oxalobacteraceae bacterium OTU3REALA1]